MFLQDSIVKEDKFGQDSAIAETPLLEIEGNGKDRVFLMNGILLRSRLKIHPRLKASSITKEL